MMRIAGPMLDGVSLHYYVHPAGGWPPRAPAVDFDEHGWADALAGARRMDDLITKHSAVMDKYDPEKRVFLAVDEWGAWYAQDPGTHPGFLRQQNTLRDALIASINLDIFAHHADRVRMSAIAQMVNVLQAMILTDGKKMVLTPTYHVFEMYKPWQDATVLPIDIKTPWYAKDEFTMPAVSGSAVRGRDGRVHVGLSNLDPNQANTVTITLDGVSAGAVSGRVLTATAINSHNTFDAPEVVKPQPFTGASMQGNQLVVTLPAKSVVVLELQ
jgi:alpha-N-arabinofuranosidase